MVGVYNTRCGVSLLFISWGGLRLGSQIVPAPDDGRIRSIWCNENCQGKPPYIPVHVRRRFGAT
jgi:hypothetical protein